MDIKSVAVVTGASRGIGRATALRLARDLSGVALAAREQESLDTAASEIKSMGAEALAFAVDLRLPQTADTVIQGTLERFGRIDALLNIAGAVPQIDLFEMTDAQWDDGMALKLHGARRLTIRAWEALKALGGRWYSSREAPRSIRSQNSRRWRRRMRRSSPWPKRLQSKELKMECRSTAWFPAR